MNPIAFSILGYDIRWYGIIIASSILIGTFITLKDSKRLGYAEDVIMDLVFWTIPAAVICARLYYVLFTWGYFHAHPDEILAIHNGGLAIHGGLIGAFIAGFFYVRAKRLNFWELADLVVPSIALGQAIGRWGNFFNQEAHGGPVSDRYISMFPAFIKQQMLIGGQYYHPTFLYESIWCIVVFIILFLYRKSKSVNGELIGLYLILYSIERVIVEGLRTDSLMFGPFRVAQLISLCLALLGALTIVSLKLKKKGNNRAGTLH